MKQHIRTIIATVTLLFTTLGVWANGTIVKVIKLNGTEVSSMSPGTVTVSENGTTRTITITPSKGYYLIKNGVSALRTITTNTPSVRNKTPGIDEGTITISGEYPTDLSGVTSLTFTMPESPYDVEITADFGNRIDITNATLTLDNNEYTYDGTAKTPSVTLVTTSEGTEYTLTAGTDYTADYSNNTNVPENANSPQPTVTITGISQYTGTATQTFTINKADATIATAPTAKELTYTGVAQELVNAGSTNDGEMQYKLSSETAWSTSIPKGTEQGTYTVNYKVVGDANHSDTESADVQVTIDAKSIANATVTLSAESFDYNGETQKPEVSSVKDGETTLTAGEDYTVTNEGGKDVGTYTVTITGTGNYTGTATKNFTIGKVAATITKAPAAIEGLKANGSAQTLITAGTADGGEMQYSTDGNNYSTALPTGTEVGTYIVYYKVVGDANHNDTEAQSLSVSIASNIMSYALWINETQVTEENVNDVLGDDATNGGGSFQYFPDTNTLFVIANKTGANIRSEISGGITIYLFAMAENKLGSITGTGKLTITTDGNFPGSLELSSTGNVISGFTDVEFGENLGILKPDDIAYANSALATTSATIGIIIDPIVEMKTETFANLDDTGNNLDNYVYDNCVLFTLRTGDGDNTDGTTYDGGVVLNTIMTQEQLNQLANKTVEDVTPGTAEYMKYFTGITILVPAGEGTIEVYGITMDGYKLGIRSLYTDDLNEVCQSTNQEPENMVFEYKFSQPTFVGIFNYGKANAARGINRAKKTVGNVIIIGVSVKPKQISASNVAKAASGGSYTPPAGDDPNAQGQLPPLGQDPDNPSIVSGIEDISIPVTANDKWYNLNGQQIDKPTQKGLYIYKGKKIFVK